MNILIVGSGAREHVIAATFNRSSQNPRLFCCGTAHHPGLKGLCVEYWVGDITDVPQVVQQAQRWHIDFAVIGPEAPLGEGLADALWACNIPTIGPKKAFAQIETSKLFARNLMRQHGIPGLPRYQSFSDLNGVDFFLQTLGENNYVIKANGLMSGKGVKVAGDHLHSFQEALDFCQEIIDQGQTIVIEEKLVGEEFSLMCFCDGAHLIPMPLVQDHKRAYNEDKGPNTGGMGSYSAADHGLPFLTTAEAEVAFAINQAVLAALQAEFNDRYIGILYGSFIATAHGVYVIEFNARFGDPEAMNVLSILNSDFVLLCQAMLDGTLAQIPVNFSPMATVCKYAVPEGYPDQPVKNKEIDISAVKNKNHLYLAAVNLIDNRLYATGSRTVAFVGVADCISAAESIAETEISAVKGPLYHREDIGTKQLIDHRINIMRRLRS